jgi:hypothetical protein
LDEGDISEIFELADQPYIDGYDEDDEPIIVEPKFYIFVYVDTINHPDYEDLEEYLTEVFIGEKKSEIFNPVFMEILNNANVVLNENAIRTFHLANLPL